MPPGGTAWLRRCTVSTVPTPTGRPRPVQATASLPLESTVSQAEVPIVSERITMTVTYARKRDIRRRHSFSIGACGRSCSVDRHLKKRKLEVKRSSRRQRAVTESGAVAPGHVLGRGLDQAESRDGARPPGTIPVLLRPPSEHSHPAYANVDERHHAREVLKA